MRIKGEKVQGVNVKECFIERSEREDGGYTFRCQTVTNEDIKFLDKVVGPAPEPPTITKKGGIQEKDFKNPDYLSALESWNAKRSAFYIVASLSATEDLEWEAVDMNDPDTWVLWSDEMAESDITDAEMKTIVETVMLANNFSKEHLRVARTDF